MSIDIRELPEVQQEPNLSDRKIVAATYIRCLVNKATNADADTGYDSNKLQDVMVGFSCDMDFARKVLGYLAEIDDDMQQLRIALKSPLFGDETEQQNLTSLQYPALAYDIPVEGYQVVRAALLNPFEKAA